MENKTKIVLLQAKELIYTGVFVILGIILLIILINMFGNKKNDKKVANAIYEPGTYTSSVALGDSSFNVSVTVSENKIETVAFDSTNEAVTTMYPLLNNALEAVKKEVKQTGSIDGISFESDYQYTGTLVRQAIEAALEKAKQ